MLDSAAPRRKAAGCASVRPSVRFRLCGDADPAASAEHVNHVDALAAHTRAARADDRVVVRYTPRFDEQITERRMREIRVGGRQDDFRITGQVEAARAGGLRCERDARQIGMV